MKGCLSLAPKGNKKGQLQKQGSNNVLQCFETTIIMSVKGNSSWIKLLSDSFETSLKGFGTNLFEK